MICNISIKPRLFKHVDGGIGLDVRCRSLMVSVIVSLIRVVIARSSFDVLSLWLGCLFIIPEILVLLIVSRCNAMPL